MEDSHYWTRPLCRGLEALGKGPKALGKGFAEGGSRQRTLGEFLDGKDGLCRGPTWPSAKKSNHNSAVSRDGVFAEGLYLRPSAKKLSRIFFKKFFAEGYRIVFAEGLLQRPSVKKMPRFFLKKNSLPRATRRPLAKSVRRNFSTNFFAEGYGEGPRQRPNICRGLWSRPSAKIQKILFLICFLHSIDINISYIYIYIYIYQPSHMYITHNLISHNISQP